MLREFSPDLIVHWIAHLPLIFFCLSEEQHFWKSIVHAYDNATCRRSSRATLLQCEWNHHLVLCAAALLHTKIWTGREKNNRRVKILQSPHGGFRSLSSSNGQGISNGHLATGSLLWKLGFPTVTLLEVWAWNKWVLWIDRYATLWKDMLSYFTEKIGIGQWCCAKASIQLCSMRAVSR